MGYQRHDLRYEPDARARSVDIAVHCRTHSQLVIARMDGRAIGVMQHLGVRWFDLISPVRSARRRHSKVWREAVKSK